MYSKDTGVLERSISAPCDVLAVQYSPDGNYLAVSNIDMTARVVFCCPYYFSLIHIFVILIYVFHAISRVVKKTSKSFYEISLWNKNIYVPYLQKVFEM